MYRQANECTAEPPFWLRSEALVSSACSVQALIPRSHPERSELAEGTGEVR